MNLKSPSTISFSIRNRIDFASTSKTKANCEEEISLSVSAIGSTSLQLFIVMVGSLTIVSFSIRNRIDFASTVTRCAATSTPTPFQYPQSDRLRFNCSPARSCCASGIFQYPQSDRLRFNAKRTSAISGRLSLSVSAIGSTSLQPLHRVLNGKILIFQYPQSDRLRFNR